MPATRAIQYAHMKAILLQSLSVVGHDENNLQTEFERVHGHKHTHQWKETFLELINVFEHRASSVTL